MRAAWGALKGAVQELNDALLEDESEEQTDTEKFDNDFQYSNETLRRKGYGSNFNSASNKKGCDYSDIVNDDFDFGINGDTKLPKEKISSTTNEVLTNSISRISKVNMSDNEINNHQSQEKSLNTNIYESEHSGESYINEEKEINVTIDEDELEELNNTPTGIIVEGDIEPEEEINAYSDNESESISCENDSISYSTEKDNHSVRTEELDYDENYNSNTNNNDEDEILDYDLPEKFAIEFEKIFQIEVKTIETLCRILQGYYSDWKGIRNDIIGNKELVLKLAPKHYESYLRRTLFDDKKPFSLGFTVLLGQCILSFVNEIERNYSQISDHKLEIDELSKKNKDLNELIKKSEVEKSENLENISKLSDLINYLKEENRRLEYNMMNESNEKNGEDKKRIEVLENERNELINKLNDMISEKDNTRNEIDKLHDHISNLTSIIEGYQTEEDQINARYEIELEKARKNERRLESKLSELDTLRKEVEDMNLKMANFNEERDVLERSISKLTENNKNLFESNEELVSQIKVLKDDQKEYMIDKRFISHLIQKYHEENSGPKYRNDIFNLLCDAIGIPKEEKSKYFVCEPKNNINPEANTNDITQNLGFADLFYNFLNSEIEGNTQNKQQDIHK